MSGTGSATEWFVLLAALAAAWSCTPAGAPAVGADDPPPVTAEDPPPSPPPAPSPEPSPPAPALTAGSSPPDPEEVAPGLAVLVAELAVAVADRDGKLGLYTADVQTLVTAAWADSYYRKTPKLTTGETVHAICPEGVAEWRTEVSRRRVQLTREGANAPRGETLCLVTKTRRPSPQARLEARPLSRPVADVKPLAAWVRRKLGREMTAVGEVRGLFGGGVDRIVVFKPARAITFQDDDIAHGDVALLVASGTPRGLLPLADYADEPGSVRAGLQTGGVVDLDGDGVEEILWLSDDLAEDGSGPLLQVSSFVGGEHVVRDILRRSYSSVREFGGQSRFGAKSRR